MLVASLSENLTKIVACERRGAFAEMYYIPRITAPSSHFPVDGELEMPGRGRMLSVGSWNSIVYVVELVIRADGMPVCCKMLAGVLL